MTGQETDHDRAVTLYSRLVALYPKAHRDQFGAQMRRTFEDAYRDATAGERRAGLGFWAAVLWDEGRCIVRERAAQPQGDLLFGGLMLLWVCVVMIATTVPAVRDWHNLVLPSIVLAVMWIAVSGRAGRFRGFATIAVVLAAVEAMDAVPQSMQQLQDFVAPVLLIACMTFAIKTVSSLNVRIVGGLDSVWTREELTYGLLIGLAGAVGLALSTIYISDGSPIFPIVFLIAVPFLSGVAGFRRSRRTMSVRAGMYTALGAILVGATIWFLALPAVIDGALLTIYHGRPATTLLPIFWQSSLSITLFWAAINGMIGAFFGGESFRTAETAPDSSSSTSDLG